MTDNNEKLIPVETANAANSELDQETADLVLKVVKETDPDKLRQYYELFNLSQSKKNLLRALKYNELLDLINEQALERVKNCPDEFANKELLDYMQVIANQLERNQKNIAVTDVPLIQVNKQEVNISVDGEKLLDRNSMERILDTVNYIIKAAEANPEIIDAAVEESKENEK